MPGMAIMTLITLAISTPLWIWFLYTFSGRRKQYLWLVLPTLPLSFAVNLLVKGPLVDLVGQLNGSPVLFRVGSPLWMILFAAFLAPVTEEAIKILPLAAPQLRRLVGGAQGGLWAGLALGIGFGLGEVAYLGYSFAKVPAYAALPWYVFTGFLVERLATVLVHGLLTGISVYGLARGWKAGLVGYKAALLLHAFVNLGAILVALRLINPAVAQLPFAISIVVLIYIFTRLRRASLPPDGTKVEEVVFERDADIKI